MKGRIHAITPCSTVNGPGRRFVVHFQGCTLDCPGCFNKDTHDAAQGREMTIDEIISQIPADAKGITISGGEPFLQAEYLLALVSELRAKNYSIIVFSGFYLREIKKIKNGVAILDLIDVLIDGRFDETMVAENGLHGSNNQTIHVFTDRYETKDFEPRDTEIWIDESGEIVMTGFPSESLLEQLK